MVHLFIGKMANSTLMQTKIDFPTTILKAVVYIREKGIVNSEVHDNRVLAGPFELHRRYNSLMISIRDSKHHEHVLYFLVIKK